MVVDGRLVVQEVATAKRFICKQIAISLIRCYGKIRKSQCLKPISLKGLIKIWDGFMDTKKFRMNTALVLLLWASHAGAQSYTVTDLGASLGVGPASSPLSSYANILSVNSAGQVAATIQTFPNTATLIGSDLSVKQITSPADGGATGATRINDAGQVVGVIQTTSGVRGFITGPNGSGFTMLGDIPGSTAEHATSVNNAGQVVGYVSSGGGAGPYAPASYTNAFVTGANGSGIQLLPNLGANSAALDINNNGLVVGTYSVANNIHSYVFNTSSASVSELGSLGGGDTYATAINDLGQVVGAARGSDGSIYAFVTDASGKNIKNLGLMGGVLSGAYDINNAGQVVGDFIVSGSTTHAFVTTGPANANAVDLNSLVTLADGAFLMSATGINDLGQIVAYGSDFHGYLLTVSNVPEPSQLLLLLPGLVGILLAHRRSWKPIGA